MNLEAILGAAQGWAQGRMLDTCTVTRVTGKTQNPTTKLYTPTTVTVYSGPCEVKQEARSVESSTGPGQVETVQRAMLKLPVSGSEGVRDGDDVLIDTSVSPGLAGLRAKVRGGHYQSAASARRIPIEVLT